ncbi:MAG: hypothetical protein AB1403_18055 [Candidatus Riflebacteria bacterium]
MIRKFTISLALFVILVAILSGCNETSPVSTGFSNDGGYSINLGATAKTVPFGGSVVFNAIIRDADGNTVMTSPHPVTFTTNNGGQVTPIQAPISNGIAQAVYVAPNYVLPANIRAQAVPETVEVPKIETLPTPTAVTSDLPRADTVVASFQGASTKITVTVFKP